MSVFTGEDTPLVRLCFSEDAAWLRLLGEIERENDDGFRAWVQVVERPDLGGNSVEDWAQLAQECGFRLVIFADERAQVGDGTLLCVNPKSPSQSFRCPPDHLWSPENNLSLANMDFEEFVTASDAGGIYRGFD